MAIPIALVGLLVSVLAFPTDETRQGRASFDLLGAAFFTVGILSGMVFLTQGSSGGGGYSSAGTLVYLAIFLGCLAVFYFVERRSGAPFIPLGLFRNPVFDAASLVRASQLALLSGALFLVPLYWVRVTHATTGAAGLGLLVLPLATVISAPISGRLTDRRGSKRVMATGMLLTAVGSVGLAFFSGSVYSPRMLVSLAILGVGVGFVQSSAPTAVSLSLPEEMLGIGLGVFNLLTYVGASVGLSVFGSLVGPVGFQVNYLIMTACGIVGGVLAWVFIPKSVRNRVPSPEITEPEGLTQGGTSLTPHIPHPRS